MTAEKARDMLLEDGRREAGKSVTSIYTYGGTNPQPGYKATGEKTKG